MYNSRKANRWCNNHSFKYFVGNQLSKTTPFTRVPQAIMYNYQIYIAHSTPIIVVRKIYFTVVVCVYLIVLYLFCIKQLFSNLSSFHFQAKDSHMHAYAHSRSPNDGHRNQQNNRLLGLFFSFITYFYIERQSHSSV